jgi:hypothetical protein
MSVMRPRPPAVGGRRDRKSTCCMVGVPIALAVGLASGAGPLGPASSLAAPAAHTAKTIELRESASLQATSKHGFTLNERGSVSGTVNGTIYVHLTVASTSRVVAEVNMYAGGGSITGQATASYRRGSTTGTFTGAISIVRGSGRYARARGSGLSFSGTIRRSDDAVTVRMSGSISD